MKKIILAIAVVLALVAGYFALQLYRPVVSNKEGKFLYIREGDDMASLKAALSSQFGVNQGKFDLARKVLRFKKPKAGRYLLSDGMNAIKLVKMLRSGSQSLVKVTIVKERTKELFSAKMGKKFDLQFDSLQMI